MHRRETHGGRRARSDIRQWRRLTPSTAPYNDCNAIVLQPDGKIVVAGDVAIDATPDFDVQVIRMIGDTIFDDTFE